MLGRALTDFYANRAEGELTVESDRADTEVYQMALFFAPFADWNSVEQRAIDLCRGHVLDIGSGAGRHSLELQSRGLLVTALEADEELTKLCTARGVERTVHAQWQHYKHADLAPDTILVLMNGLGLAGYHDKLLFLARYCYRLLPKGGQVLADSSEISYLPPSAKLHRRADEIYFRFAYLGQHSNWFSWLFASKQFAVDTFTKAGFNCTATNLPGEDRFLLQAIKA